MLLWRATSNKNTDEYCSRVQKTKFSKLSFKLASTSSLQWFCTITFPDSTYVKFKVFIAECVTSESHKKQKHWGMSQQGTENSICRGIFQISSDIITTMILQTNIFKFNLCPIESLYGRVCYFGKPWKKEILINIAAGNRKQHFQNYLLNWLRHYQYNYSAK